MEIVHVALQQRQVAITKSPPLAEEFSPRNTVYRNRN